MELLEKLLVDLHESIENQDLQVDAVSLVANIEGLALAEMDSADLEYTTTLIFHSTSPPSLVMFLEQSSRSKDKEIIGAKKHALKFMALFVKAMPYMVEKFNVEVLMSLIDLFKKETSGEVKSCLLLPVKNILRMCYKTEAKDRTSLMSAEEVHLDLIYRVLIDELSQSPSKLGKGLRCEGLKTLGLLVAYFPSEAATVQVIDAVLNLCETNLTQNFAKTCKDPDFSAIAGSFSCLDRCLSHFEDRYAGSASLWRYLLQAVMATTQKDTSRYAASSKAVRLISHHAELFQSLIGLNASQSYNLLYQMYVAEKKAMVKHSANSLYSVLRRIGAYVVLNYNTADTADAVRTVLKLYGEFMCILDGSSGGSKATDTKNNDTSDGGDAEQQEGLMHAVQGLAAIAPALVTIANSYSNSIATGTTTATNVATTGTTTGTALSITATVHTIIEAAHHFVRYQESLAVMTADASAGISTGDGSVADTTSTTAESAAAEGTQVTTPDAQQGYENIAFKHRKVLFLMAVTSFVSAVGISGSANTPTPVLVFSPGLVQFLEQYTVDVVVTYSRFWSKQQAQVCSTLCTLMHALLHMQNHPHQYHNGSSTPVASTSLPVSPAVAPVVVYCKLLDCLTSSLLLRTLSRTSAHETINPAQVRLSQYTGTAEDRLLFAYVDLWAELLCPQDRHIRALIMQYYAPNYSTFARSLYDSVLEQVLHMLTTLDLSYEYVNDVSGSGGDGAGVTASRVLVPSNIADQDVLLNLVAFLEELLPMAEGWFPGALVQWLPLLVHRVVQLSTEHPLLSALYRLTTCLLRVSGDAFATINSRTDDAAPNVDLIPDEANGNGDGPGAVAAQGPTQKDASLMATAAVLRTHMLALQQRVASSSPDFQQDLLDAVLCMILHTPRSILPLQDVISTVHLSLTSGIQALLAVQLMTSQLLQDKETLLPYLPALLPLFDKYLSSASGTECDDSKMYLRSAAAMSKMIRKSRSSVGTSDEVDGSASYAVQVQYALLRLLGRLGGVSQQILVPASDTVQNSLVWSDKQCVCIDLPSPVGSGAEAHMRVCIDVLLPRIIALCNASTSGTVDPQSLSAAAEALHGLVLYMVGTASAVASMRTKNTQFSALYERIFPTIIKLSVMDFMCRALYEKLLFQLIRWFSGYNQVSERDAGALLDALFGRLGDPAAEGAEREMCARGIQEFFSWAVKQSTKTELASKHPGSVESIMERVCLLIGHPIEAQRTAAVAVLRKIYATLREESSLVRIHALRVIYLLTKSMRLFESEAVQQDISEVLLKFEEMVVVTIASRDDVADLLRPVEERGYPLTLADLVQQELWAGALTSDNLLHRRQCMRCFSALAPLLQLRSGSSGSGATADPLNTAKAFMQSLAAREYGGSVRTLVLSTIERAVLPVCMPAMSAAAVMESADPPPLSLQVAAQWQWLQSLNARIDAYNWLIKMDYVSAQDLFLNDDAVTSVTISADASATAGKKRKAAKDDGATAAAPGGAAGNVVTSSSLFACIAAFISDGGTREATFCSLSTADRDAESALLKLEVAHRECLYRTLLLLSNMLASAAPSMSTQASLLAKTTVWGEQLHRAVVRTLLPDVVKSTEGGGGNGNNVALAVQQLYAQATALPDSTGVGRTFSEAARQYINSTLDQIGGGDLPTVAGKVSVQLRRLLCFHQTVQACRLLSAVFGRGHEVENRLFAVSVLQNVLDAIPRSSGAATTGSKASVVANSSAVVTVATASSAAGGDANPAVLDLGAAALELAVELGLTLLSSASVAADEVSLMELLQHSQHGAVLLTHYRDRLLALLTGPNARVSLDQRANLATFVHHTYATTATTTGLTTSPVHLQSLFPLVISQVISNDQMSGVVSVVVDVCANASVFDLLPDNVILLLLEACARSATSTPGASAVLFRQQVLHKCVTCFSGSPGGKAPKDATAEVDMLLSRLQWLPYLLEGTVEGAPMPYTAHHSAAQHGAGNQQVTTRQKLLDALDELAADRFPLDSHSLSSSTAEGRHYFKLLRAYLTAYTQCGSVLLLAPLIPSLREGGKHKYYGLFTAAFRAVTSNVSVDPVSDPDSSRGVQQMYVAVRVLASYCAKQILDEYQDQAVKHTLFQHLLVPTLMRCPAAALIHIFTATRANTALLHADMQVSFDDAADGSVVKQLCDILAKDPHAALKKSGSDVAAALVYIQSCAYRMLEVLYDRCSLPALKSMVTQAFVGTTDGVTGKELTQTICRAAHKQLRAPKMPADCITAQLTTALYSAAYRCLAIVVAKTQAEEQFFDTFLFKEKVGEEVWERMIGECVVGDNGSVVNGNVYAAASGRFATVAIGNSEFEVGDQQVQALYYAQRRQRQQHLRSRQAASAAIGGAGYLTQYIAGSVIESSSASQAYTRVHRSGGSVVGNSVSQNTSSTQRDLGEGYTVSQYAYASKMNAGKAAASTELSANTQRDLYAARVGSGSRTDVVEGLDDQVIYLELNDINRVPAMGCLVRVIQRMEILFRTKWEATGYSETDLPQWLAACRDKLIDVTSIGQTANVRLFVLRLLMNEPVASIVTPWVQHMLPAILNCALSDLCGIDLSSTSVSTSKVVYPRRGTAKGSCYSYVLRDLVFALCDAWSTAVASVYCGEQASFLLNYLLEHVFDADQNILKENVLSVKGLITQWIPNSRGDNGSGGSGATVQLQLRLHPLIELMLTAHSATGGAHAAATSRGTEGVRKRLAALDLVKHLLQVNYPVLEQAHSVRCGGSALLGAVLDCVKFPRKEVIESGCEVAGLLLSTIAQYTSTNRAHLLVPEYVRFQSSLEALLEQKLVQKGGNDIAATCLRAVTARCPQFLTRDLLMKTVYNIGRLSPRSKYEYLEMLCKTTSTSTFDGLSLLNDVLRPHLLAFLADLSTVVFGRGKYTIRLPMVQINMLLLIRKHIAELSWDVVETVMGSSATEGLMLCVSAQSVLQVRHAAYQALLALWQLRLTPSSGAAQGGSTDANRINALRRRVCQLLLNGLRDKDTVGMNEQTPAETAAAGSGDASSSSVSLSGASDNSATRYDDPRHWADDNTSRIGIRKQLFDFFESQIAANGYGLSANYSERLHALMSELFDPSQPQQWLQYTSFLTLSVSRRSAAYTTLLFQHSLGDASTFIPLEVKQSKHGGDSLSAMTPLFSLERTTQSITQSQAAGVGGYSQSNIQATQSYLASQPRAGTLSTDGWTERRAGYLRGTQQLSWTQTQQSDGGRQLVSTGGGGGTGAGNARRSGAVVDTSSTQFTAINRRAAQTTSQLIPSASGAGPSISAGGEGSAAGTNGGVSAVAAMGPPIGLPRYVTTQRVPIRFTKKKDTSAAEDAGDNAYSTGSLVSRAAKYASVAAMQAGSKMMEQRRQQEKQSGGKGRVVVYRKYRQGELPDIAIRCSDILQPLQSLCLLDDVTAGLMFGALFDTMYVTQARGASGGAAMCGDVLSMLQSIRTAGAANSNLCASLLRRSTFCLQQCIESSGQTGANDAAPKPASRGAKGRTSAPAVSTPAPAVSAEMLLPAELVAECAIQSSNYHSGIHVLEEQLRVLQQVPHLIAAVAAVSLATGSIAGTTAAPVAGRKRNIQATVEDTQSDNDDASQVSVSAPSTSKRARSSASVSSTSATTAALLKRKPKGRKTATKASIDDDDAASQSSQQSQERLTTANADEDAPTQQVEGLTADELLDQMSGDTAISSVPSVSVRRGKAAATKGALPSAMGSATALTPAQSHQLHRQRRSIWHQLYRLYDRLGEKDVLLGLTARLSEDAAGDAADVDTTTSATAMVIADDTVQQRSDLTRRALDAELSGDFQEAVRIYASLNEATESANGDALPGISQEERNLWDERSLLCLKQLTDWQQLYDCVGKVARISLYDADGMQTEPGALWEVLSNLDSRSERQSRLKEQVLPHYLQSLLHLGCPYSDTPTAVAENERAVQERDAFIERVLSYQSTTVSNTKDAHTAAQYELRQYVESNFPMELAVSFASNGQWARTRLYCEQSYQRFITQWSSLHPCATEARRQLLTQLQPILELRDAADFYSSTGICDIGGNGGGLSERSRRHLGSLVSKWEVSEPSIADATAHWANVTGNRHISLQNALQSAPTSVDSTDDGTVVRAAKVQLASMHVKTAAAAVHQGVLTAVKSQLEINNAIRRSVYGKKAILTMPEVRVVYDYNSRSIARLLDSATADGGGTNTSVASVAAQVEGMFQKTMGLLDKKAELLQESRRSVDAATLQLLSSHTNGGDGRSEALDALRLMLLRADWLVKWASSISTTRTTFASGGGADAGEAFRARTLDALELYQQCTEGTANIRIPHKSHSQLSSLQNQLCTSYTLHCDSLLQCFERAHDAAATLLAQDFTARLNSPQQTACNEAATLTVQCFVQGLKIGNAHCIQRVLRLVQIIGAYPHTEHILRTQLASIPAWVFLQFAAQLMGSLDRPEGVVICALLEHTAAAYPTALYYPYRITSEFLGPKGRERSAKLASMLRNNAQDSFIEALGGLTHPEHRWNDGIKELDTIFRGSGVSSTASVDEGTRAHIVNVYAALRRRTLDTEWANVGPKIGNYNRQWARNARSIADKLAGAQGEKLVNKKALDALREAINNSKFSESMPFDGGKVALAEFSQWLCDFDALHCHIEMPGQYSNMSAAAAAACSVGNSGGGGSVCYGAPRVHESIVAVDPTLLVMSSLRKPKRIKLYGSAGGQHYFLVKGGEDLRNDERIEQLFSLMNTVVQAGVDTDGSSGVGGSGGGNACGGLRARTYAVIPMTSQLGVLEWVSNTTPLKCIISEEMGKDDALCAANPQACTTSNGVREVELMALHAFEARKKFVYDSYDHQAFHRMFKSASREQATDVYNSITATLPSDYIRRRFQSIALTAEAFVTIRSEFAKTLAVSSLFGYILGLGDRHLENLLVDVTTGAVIQIDFGYCFGMSASVLRVPELLPFRLTPQLRAVLQPLDGVGLLRRYMMQCLQALRADASSAGLTPPAIDVGSGSHSKATGKAKSSKNDAADASDQPPESYSGIIPNALEVYLNDPVVDWVKGSTANKGGKAVTAAGAKKGTSSSAAGTAASAAADAESAAASLREEWTERREDMQWEPRRRVHIAVQKLTGADPAAVLLMDLQMNAFVRQEKSLSALQAIVTTAANGGSRGNSVDGVLCVGQQVDRLINIATDPDVLVRQWSGLQTWL